MKEDRRRREGRREGRKEERQEDDGREGKKMSEGRKEVR
jgi:hypothetical protein